MGFTPGDPLTDASSGMTSSSASGVPYVRNLNDGALESSLEGYGSALLAYLGTSLPAAGIDDVVGGARIQRYEAPAGGLRQANLPYTSSVSDTWTGGIPDQYRTELQVEILKKFLDFGSPTGMSEQLIINETLFVDEIYGKKLVVTPNYPQGDHLGMDNFFVSLALTARDGSGASIASHSTASDKAQLRDGRIFLTANHPYAASAGAYMDVEVEKEVFMFLPLTIIHGWGYVNDGLSAAWGTRNDSAGPDIPYEEFGCDKCEQYYYASKGDGRREQLAVSWLVDSSRAAHLHAAIADSIYTHHHSLGVSTADSAPHGIDLIPTSNSPTYYVVTDSFDRLDVDTGFSLTSTTADGVDRRAAVHAIAATLEALEGTTAGNIADIPDTTSTATRFAWGNSPPPGEDLSGGYGPRRFYRYNSANASQALSLSVAEGMSSTANDGRVSSPNVEPELGNGDVQTRRNNLADAIDEYAAAGFDVVASQESFLGPGQRGGDSRQLGAQEWFNIKTQQRGGAFVATRYASNEPVEIAHIVVGHDENAKGGGGGVQSNHQSQYDPAKAADVLKSLFVDRTSAVGVDMKSGTITYVAPAQIAIGNGGFPYALTARFIWRGGNAPSTQFGPIVHTQPQTPWTTNWHNNLTVSGSALEAMGATDVRAAAGTIAAFVAQQDVYRAPVSTQREVAGVLIAAWWAQQVSGNVVTVSVGADSRQFLRDFDLANNAQEKWFAPGSAAHATMTKTGERVPYMHTCSGTGWTHARGWDYSGVSFDVTNAHGDKQAFDFWENGYHAGATSSECATLHGFRMTNWTFPQGVTLNFVYTSQGSGALDRFTEVNNSLGRRIRFSYDTTGKLTGFNNGLTGADLRTVTIGNTGPSFSVDSVTDPEGAKTRFAATVVGGEHRLDDVFDADDTTVPSLRYTYDTAYRVKEARDALALQGTRNPYEFRVAPGVRATRTDPAGGEYTVLFDTDGHPMRYINEIGAATEVAHDGRGRVTRYTYPEGNEELLEYDARNNVTKRTRVASGGGLANIVAQASWHATWNKPSWIRDAKGHQTDFVYFASGNGRSLLSTATRPSADGSAPRPVYGFTYNGRGQVLTATGPTGLVTSNSYHATNGNLLSTTVDPSGFALVTGFGYDAQGLRTSVTDPRGNVTETIYDDTGRPTHTLSHNGGIAAALLAAQRTTYDLLGQPKKQEAGISFSGTSVTGWQVQEQRTYTPTGQVETVTNAEGQLTSTSYDPLDRVDVVTDAVGRRTKNAYDDAGQLLIEYRAWRSGFLGTDPDSSACQVADSLQQCYATWTYTPNGRPATVEDANGNLTTYAYDDHGRLSRTYFPSKTTAGSSSSTDFEEFRYDPASNVTGKRTRKGDWVLSAFDRLGQSVRKLSQTGGSYSAIPMTCGAGATEVCSTYDLAGRPDIVRFGNSSHVIDYGYDSAGRLATVADDSRTLGYLYDAASNRRQLSYPGADNFYVTYEHDALNRLQLIREKGSLVLADYDYDEVGRRERLTYGNGRVIDYTYWPDSAVKEIRHNNLLPGSVDAVWSFVYTDANQVESRSTPTAFLWVAPANETFAYVPNGLNQYTSINGQSLGYDNNGSLTGDGVWSYGYDVENRLTSATKAAEVQASFGYDPLGRRDAYTVDGNTTRYLSDGIEEIADYGATGTLLRRYVHGPGIDERLVMYTGTSLSSKQYYHTDHQGTTVAISSNAGTLGDQYTYSAFGEIGAEGPAGNPFRYTGRRLDAETGLYYYRARYYSPTLGRFLQTDPVGYNDQMNLYTHVANDPINNMDPTGTYGRGSGFTDREWDRFDKVQQQAASRMERTADKLDKKAAKLDEKGEIGGDSLRAAAGRLRAGAEALRSDGSDGKIANAVDATTYNEMGGTEGGAAFVKGNGPVMTVNRDNEHAWKSGSRMAQWVVGHESLHTGGLHDRSLTKDGPKAYKYGEPPNTEAYRKMKGTWEALINPDHLMDLVY